MAERGLIHIYCGDGKGKTTAALGLSLRATCAGKRVSILQFLKSDDSSEMLLNLKNMSIHTAQKSVKFVFQMSESERAVNRLENHEAFSQFIKKADSFDLLVFDEIIGCIAIGQFDKALLMDFLKNKPERLEVVMTGRDPLPELLEIADYVSEVKKIKHPFDNGIGARKGIEF